MLFVDETAIADLNQRFMGSDGPDRRARRSRSRTSSSSPAASPTRARPGPVDPRDRAATPPEPPLLLGDVVICPAVAARNAPSTPSATTAPSTTSSPCCVVHGILHVLGHDHAEPEENAAMQAKERELLAPLPPEAA